jgi:hypothetical protein
MPDILVSQNVETQTVLDNNITIQVAQKVQEQITIGVPGPRGPAGTDGIPVLPDVIDGGVWTS